MVLETVIAIVTPIVGGITYCTQYVAKTMTIAKRQAFHNFTCTVFQTSVVRLEDFCRRGIQLANDSLDCSTTSPKFSMSTITQFQRTGLHVLGPLKNFHSVSGPHVHPSCFGCVEFALSSVERYGASSRAVLDHAGQRITEAMKEVDGIEGFEVDESDIMKLFNLDQAGTIDVVGKFYTKVKALEIIWQSCQTIRVRPEDRIPQLLNTWIRIRQLDDDDDDDVATRVFLESLAVPFLPDLPADWIEKSGNAHSMTKEECSSLCQELETVFWMHSGCTLRL